jgi:mRNA-degrading endonuclease RelE of RelBE toxin-antitoxin system
VYTFEIKEGLEKSLQRLAKKDKQLYEAVTRKILHIAENPAIGKPLRNILKGKKRVHIGHFVLIYEVNNRERKVIFLEFEHHDKAYTPE